MEKDKLFMLFIVLLALVLVLPFSYAELYEYEYGVSDTASIGVCENSGCGEDMVLQSFTIGTKGDNEDFNLTTIAFRSKYAVNPPTQNLTIYLYSNTTGTMTAIYSQSFANPFSNTFSTKNFTLSTPQRINASSSKYYIGFYSPEDLTHYYHFAINDSNPYPTGQTAKRPYNSDTTFISVTTRDIYFAVFGNAITTPPPAPDNTTYFSITAKNEFTNDSILYFSAEVNNTIYSTENGTITTTIPSNSTGTYYINVYDNYYEVYFNYSVNAWDISTNLIAPMFQNVITFTAKDLFTSLNVETFNITAKSIDYTTFKSTTNGTIIFHLIDNTFNFSINSPGYDTININSYELISLDNISIGVLLSKKASIIAKNKLNTSIIPSFTLTMVGMNISHTYTNSTTNGSITLYVRNQTYNISAVAPGYATYNQIYTFNNSFEEYTLYLYTTNSYNVTFKDEVTLTKITGVNITLDLISDTYSNSYRTDNGSVYIDLLTPIQYQFRYSGAGYQPRINTFTMVNGTFSELTLYLLSGGGNVSLYVLDSVSQPVETATIYVYRYSTASNSYVLVTTIDTDFQGKAVVNLQLSAEFYKFYIYYQGDLKLQTSGAYVTSDTIYFTINLNEPILQEYYSIQDINYYVDFNEATGNFRFYYLDTTNTAVTQGCLYLYSSSMAGDTLENSTCISSSSGTLYLNAVNVTGKHYVARGFVTIGGNEIFLASEDYTYNNPFLFGDMGIFLVFMLVLVSGFVAIWDLSAGLILIPLPIVLGTILNWINIPIGYSVGLWVGFIVLAFIVRRGK